MRKCGGVVSQTAGLNPSPVGRGAGVRVRTRGTPRGSHGAHCRRRCRWNLPHAAWRPARWMPRSCPDRDRQLPATDGCDETRLHPHLCAPRGHAGFRGQFGAGGRPRDPARDGRGVEERRQVVRVLPRRGRVRERAAKQLRIALRFIRATNTIGEQGGMRAAHPAIATQIRRVGTRPTRLSGASPH